MTFPRDPDETTAGKGLPRGWGRCAVSLLRPQDKLDELLKSVRVGRLQLPDFQRDWKWDDDRIRSLLATLTLGYPMGVLMTLETSEDVRWFKARPLAGAEKTATEAPQQLLLDGQQRLTSLFRALCSGEPVATTGARMQPILRWYYIDIALAVAGAGEREEAIKSVSEYRWIRKTRSQPEPIDLSTQEKECAAGLFPLRLAFDSDGTHDWMIHYLTPDMERRGKLWKAFRSQVLDNVTGYLIPVIALPKDTAKEAVCTVFEKVNTGGVPLNVFELLTASYAGEPADVAGEEFSLAEDWEAVQQELAAAYPVLAEFTNSDYLQAICLARSYVARTAALEAGREPAAVGCSRRDILNLPLAEYLAWRRPVIDALKWVAGFLREQCVFTARDLPYRTQLVPFAAIKVALGDRADAPDALSRLARWYWSGVLGEMYGGTTESRFPRDLEQVVDWITAGGSEPGTVRDATFRADRLDTLASRNSAAYKGIFALLMRQGAVDWYYSKDAINGELVEDQQIDLRPIFPKSWCAKAAGVSDAQSRCIVNKTPLSGRVGRTLGDLPPSAYLRALEVDSGQRADWLDDTVRTHLISPKYLRADDFAGFYRDRAASLLELIEQAMERRVVARDAAGADDAPSA